jgi:hypothetical protein
MPQRDLQVAISQGLAISPQKLHPVSSTDFAQKEIRHPRRLEYLVDLEGLLSSQLNRLPRV